MLAELSIKNFAIIDDLRVRFEGGLTVITGETGAGKSILIQAVNLLLGGRAYAAMIRTGAPSAELEALFTIRPNTPFAKMLAEKGVDVADGLLVHRVISAKGGHRVYINGRLATMGMLSEITEPLASVSGQHAHQTLLKPETHLLIIDRFGGLMPLREKVGGLYEEVQAAWKILQDLVKREKRAAEHRELLEFQAKEIAEAQIQPEEDQELEGEKKRLEHAAKLFETAKFCERALYSGQGAAAEALAQVQKMLEQACELDAALKPQAEAVSQALFAAEDAAAELRTYSQGVVFDKARLQDVDNRLHFLAGLKKKYGGSLEAVELRAGEIQEELKNLQSLGRQIQQAREELDKISEKLNKVAAELTEKRKRAAHGFCKQASAELSGLGMEGTRLEVEFSPVPVAAGNGGEPRAGEGVEATGAERAQFLISPNVGEEPKPLKEIASGGELSRTVLAVKVLLAHTDMVETVIFDEVDAGIGGAVADAVGEKLVQLATGVQVICITHLPQIARLAQNHLSIAKGVEKGRTVSAVRGLSPDERVEELARMLAGGRVTDVSRQHAREMLSH